MPKKGDKVYKRKDGLWEARYVKEIGADGKKRYGSVYARSCAAAKEKRQAAMDSILLYGRTAAPREVTVGRLATEWLEVNRGRLKPSTYRRYEGYKAQRKPMPEELAVQLPLIRQVLDALGASGFTAACSP